MDYIDQLIEGIVERKLIDKYDALISILTGRVCNAVWMETKEELEPLLNSIEHSFYSIFDSSFGLSGVYNDPVNIGDMTDTQRAYLCGRLAAYQSILSITHAERPTASELKFARDNISRLEALKNADIKYVALLHGDLFENNLINTSRYGQSLICILTPFAKSILNERNHPTKGI